MAYLESSDLDHIREVDIMEEVLVTDLIRQKG